MEKFTAAGLAAVEEPDAVFSASHLDPGTTAAVQLTADVASTRTWKDPFGFPVVSPVVIWNCWPAGFSVITLPFENSSVTGKFAAPADVETVIELRYKPGLKPLALAVTVA